MMPDVIKPPRHRHITRSLLLAAGGLFITAAALAVVNPTTHPELIYQANTVLDLPPIDIKAGSEQAPYIATTRIQRGDTLADLLQRLGVNQKGLLPFLTHNEDARSIYKLYPGRVVKAALDNDGNMLWFRYMHTPSTLINSIIESAWLEVKPIGNDDFIATEETAKAMPETRVAEGEIIHSLFGAADKVGVPDSIVTEMVNILSSRIDFYKDLRKGDKFRIVFDSYTHDGENAGAGRIRALEFLNKGKTYSAIWFRTDEGKGGYYDFEGNSLKGAFLRNSIKFTRISSRFGMRKHPIHKRWIGHKGVDYAAATGTPIHATADGTVEFIGKQRGYGNVIILKNYGKYSTLYAHQSRFAKGLKRGAKVEQGQVIGYVGSTGWATGPHLHYEFKINNKPVDPLSVDLPVTRTLEQVDKKAFKAVVAKYQPQMEMLSQLQESRVKVAINN